MLANRLNFFLNCVISETQSAFVLGRLITDNVLIAFETLHYMHNKRMGKVDSMALELDMSKAYDRVDWGFLEQIMLKMGFHTKWVSLIMECIRMVSYSLPISPYLFLLCAEGLNGLLNQAAQQREIHGVSISRRSPALTHLFFADDSLFFYRANHAECQKIREILQIYE